MTDLSALGYDSFFEGQFEALADRQRLVPARVRADSGDLFELDGTAAHHAVLAGKLRQHGERPTTGDWVAVERETEPAVIRHILERKTALVRRAAGSASRAQVVAANVDVYFIVTSANLEFHPRRIERYLTAVWDSGARPVIVLNKLDLVDDAAGLLSRAQAVGGGVSVVPVSATTRQGMDSLAAQLGAGLTFGFVGSSGVGKSTLINALLGRALQTTSAVGVDDKGDHTTSRRELSVLPGRGVLVDTPGMRELGLLLAGGGLDRAFAEVAEVAARCRFHDCQHGDQPGCAVTQAVADGELSAERVASWQKLQGEVASSQVRHDPRLGANAKRRWKAINKQQRAIYRQRGGDD